MTDGLAENSHRRECASQYCSRDVADLITFEHPLNEKCRTLLRLSHLFDQLAFHRDNPGEWASRAAMGALLEIANVLARADIKSDLFKELDRFDASLSRMADMPNVDTGVLDQILDNIRACSHALQGLGGQLGSQLRADDFLTSIQQRSSIPGGSFDFDLPQFHLWLQLPYEQRRAHLQAWQAEITPVRDATELILDMIRNSDTPTREQAERGFFQKSLPTGISAQMVRVKLPADLRVYAEVSGGKHRFSIRILESADWGHPTQVDFDLEFQLTTCVL